MSLFCKPNAQRRQRGMSPKLRNLVKPGLIAFLTCAIVLPVWPAQSAQETNPPIRAQVVWSSAQPRAGDRGTTVQLEVRQAGDYGVWVHLRAKGGVPPHLLVTVDPGAVLAIMAKADDRWEWAPAFDLTKRQRARIALRPAKHSVRFWQPAAAEKLAQIEPFTKGQWFGVGNAAARIRKACSAANRVPAPIEVDELLLSSAPGHDPNWIETRESLRTVLPGWRPEDFSSRLDAVSNALRRARPSCDNVEPRIPILGQLDEALRAPFSWRNPAVVAYYQAMVDRALDEVERETVREGIVLWKLYSSSFLVKTPKTVFGIDLDQGPNQRSLDKTPAQEGVALAMTQGQKERLGELVEYSFHTHFHHDHIDYELVRELLKRGKTVIVTEENARAMRGKPFYEKAKRNVRTPPQTDRTPVRLGPLAVYVCRDCQYMREDRSAKAECNAYIIVTDDGCTIMSKGDLNCGDRFVPWLKAWKDQGHTLDIYASSFWSMIGPRIQPQVVAMLDPLLVPAHEYEFTHHPGLQWAGASYAGSSASLRQSASRGKAVVLSWGERFVFCRPGHRRP